MKTMVLAFALTLCAGISTYAQQDVAEKSTIEYVAQQEDVYVKISFDDLNSNVQNAITKLSEEFTVKELAYNVEKKLTKITLVSKADESEKIVILDDEGKAIQ
ncbi:hypothetical protein [Massilibacteroides vaginae]|uniref:hypothetical protein n=1 Tax=Massilibacteroides vaginae TaxID=1673718 RepID=UPI000A1CAF34|nr:hypothetical protein [Massilibacteroides vaginae]